MICIQKQPSHRKLVDQKSTLLIRRVRPHERVMPADGAAQQRPFPTLGAPPRTALGSSLNASGSRSDTRYSECLPPLSANALTWGRADEGALAHADTRAQRSSRASSNSQPHSAGGAASRLRIAQAADRPTARTGVELREFGRRRVKKALLGGDTGGPTKRTKIANKINALQRAKIQSSTRILGPSNVIAVEVFGGRAWQPLISTGGVAVERAQLRPRVLIDARQP